MKPEYIPSYVETVKYVTIYDEASPLIFIPELGKSLPIVWSLTKKEFLQRALKK